MPVQEQGGIFRKRVGRPLLRQEAMNRQEIAENPHTAFSRVAALRNRLRCRVAFADRGEDF
jgi:hypothetical protein